MQYTPESRNTNGRQRKENVAKTVYMAKFRCKMFRQRFRSNGSSLTYMTQQMALVNGHSICMLFYNFANMLILHRCVAQHKGKYIERVSYRIESVLTYTYK